MNKVQIFVKPPWHGRRIIRGSKMKKLIIFLAIFLGVTNTHAWTLKTHLGITVTASPITIKQYEKTWNSKWEDIDWEKIDQIYLQLQEAYHSHPNPAKLKIQIHSWFCEPEYIKGTVVANPPCRRCILTDEGCVTAIFPSWNIIAIHLGNDPGQGECAWGYTALDYELGHWFLLWLKDPCWYNEFSGGCPRHYIYLECQDE